MPRTNGLTVRQKITLREYRRGHVTQAQLAREWGISQQAVSGRLTRARRARGEPRPPRRLPRLKIRRVYLSDLAREP